jgi:DNA-binding transcriptional MerR regulator
MYRVSEFAEMAGLTVRTLHHYDRLGLLQPSGHTRAGYRLYNQRDFARLQQIVTLKFIGFPLKQIKDLLDRRDLDLAETLRFQREALLEKRRQLEMAVDAIAQAERATQSGLQPDWASLRKIIEVMEMQNNMDWVMKYYSEEARAKIAERGKNWTPELQAKAEQDWKDLIRDVENAQSSGMDPAGPQARALVERWSKLIEAFTGGDPEITKGLGKLYSDQSNWPSTFQKPFGGSFGEFMKKAMAAHKG